MTEVVNYINTLISLDVTKLGLCERVNKFTEPIQIYPAKYIGAGQYEPVNLDNYSGVLYHRLNGTQNSVESESRTGCGMDLTITQNMRLVLYCPKNILNLDDEGSVLRIGSNLRKEISFNNSELVETLKCDYVSCVVSSIDFDSVNVWNSEFQNVNFAMDYRNCLIAFDYLIEIKGDKECLLEYSCA